MPTKTTAHLHSCTQCLETYEDSCETPKVNARCNVCISGIPQKFGFGRWPVLCCYTHTRSARPDEKKTYRLAGDGLWFICNQCHRTFGYDPRKDTP